MHNPWDNINKPANDLNVLRVSAQHHLDLYWGKNHIDKYLFVYDSKNASAFDNEQIARLEGINIITAGSRLVLVLNDKANWELFHALCSDLINSTSKCTTPDSALSVLLRRLEKWKDFLKSKAPSRLSDEAIKGLIGEMLFLKNQLAPAFGWDDAMESWHGPEGAPQDFAIHTTAIEVKCQSGSTTPVVKISSIDQLNPQLPEGYLVVYTIASAPDNSGALTLNDLVRDLRSCMESENGKTRELFEDKLLDAKYTMLSEYDNLRFQVTDIKCFRISDGFPRILATNVPQGLEKISYNLKIDACANFSAKPLWWNNK